MNDLPLLALQVDLLPAVVAQARRLEQPTVGVVDVGLEPLVGEELLGCDAERVDVQLVEQAAREYERATDDPEFPGQPDVVRQPDVETEPASDFADWGA